jgi:hypothetical protein
MRTLSTILAFTLTLAPASASAQSPDELAKVERLYNEGRDLYETADYDGAIAKWTEAYSLLGDSAESAEIRTTLLYNLSSAHEAAFDIDGDVTHLTKAKVLLERFAQQIDGLYTGEAGELERQRVHERVAGIDAKLAAARGDETKSPQDDDPVEPVEPATEPDPEPVAQPDPPTDHPKTANKPLLIAGSASLVLGLGGLGLGVAAIFKAERANEFGEQTLDVTPEALALRHEQIRQGQQMNALTYAGLIAGGVLVVTGATLLGLSKRTKSNTKSKQIAAISSMGPSMGPSVGPNHAGVLIQGSF